MDHDHYGKFKTCVQCGYMRDLAEIANDESPLLATASGTDDGVSFKAFTAMLAAN